MAERNLNETELHMLVAAAKRNDTWNAFLRLEQVMEDGSFENDLQTFSIDEMKAKYGDKSFSMMASDLLTECFGADSEVNLLKITLAIRKTARIQLGFRV